MKNVLKSLVVVGLISAAGIAQANIFGDTFNTAGNVVKGAVNVPVVAAEDLAEGNIGGAIVEPVGVAANTAANAVADTGKTVTNVFDDNEYPVESNEFRDTEEGPLFDVND
ncbi:MAG: hypothetical protein P4L31_05340 [Candidatus Babeliales bacterium]|nr:hypothetical protein [Candidatus Babeliales bacterium]